MCTPAHKRLAVAPGAGGLRRQRGAAVLILLLSLILGAGTILMHAYGGSDRARRERETLHTLAEAQEALLGYAMTHGRLPRPASSATDGHELVQPCESEQRCTGYLPWATLSLPPSIARGLPLRYSVTPAFAGSAAPLSAAVGTKTISRRSSAGLQYRWGGAYCTQGLQCLPAVIIASGKYQGAIDADTGDQAANARASVHFIERPYSDDERAPGGAFDDVVTPIPYGTLRLRMISGGNWQ